MAHPDPSINGAVARNPAMPAVRRLGRFVLDALLPPLCLGCGVVVDEAGVLCPACWRAVRFLGPPQCAACGVPFEFDPGPDALCGSCAREPPAFARARAAFAYDETSRRLILAFKHGDRTDAAPAFGAWLARTGADLIPDADVIVPVPLHWTRLFWRRYNQAALLAHALSRAAGVPVAPDLLVRTRRTPSQGKLSPLARRRNLAGAFAVRRSTQARMAGRRVLLIDDVLTTGATAAGCAKALLAAGARAVDVLTLARVVRPVP
jgi:ComF family protein